MIPSSDESGERTDDRQPAPGTKMEISGKISMRERSTATGSSEQSVERIITIRSSKAHDIEIPLHIANEVERRENLLANGRGIHKSTEAE